MSESLRKFVARAPRYVLRPQDRKVMRFSLEHTLGDGGIEQTLLINLSETGAAFLVSPGYGPSVGERIKVEVPIPGDEQFAWWARVVRTQEYEPHNWGFRADPAQTDNKILVGLKFDRLPEQHRNAIRRGLNKSFMQAMRDQQFRTWLYYRSVALEHAGKAILFLVLLAGVCAFVYWFSLPSATYDGKRGAPWGERFK